MRVDLDQITDFYLLAGTRRNHPPAPQLVRVHGRELVEPEGPPVVGAPKGDIAARGLEGVRLVIRRLRLRPDDSARGGRACVITIEREGERAARQRMDFENLYSTFSE